MLPVKPGSRLALGAVIGIVAGLIAAIVRTPLTQTDTARACDSESRVCVKRTQAPGFILLAPKDDLWISIDVDSCGTEYRTPFDLPDGELDVSFMPKYLELRSRSGDLARYETTSTC
jgi:hypothetical protein